MEFKAPLGFGRTDKVDFSAIPNELLHDLPLSTPAGRTSARVDVSNNANAGSLLSDAQKRGDNYRDYRPYSADNAGAGTGMRNRSSTSKQIPPSRGTVFVPPLAVGRTDRVDFAGVEYHDVPEWGTARGSWQRGTQKQPFSAATGGKGGVGGIKVQQVVTFAAPVLIGRTDKVQFQNIPGILTKPSVADCRSVAKGEKSGKSGKLSARSSSTSGRYGDQQDDSDSSVSLLTDRGLLSPQYSNPVLGEEGAGVISAAIGGGGGVEPRAGSQRPSEISCWSSNADCGEEASKAEERGVVDDRLAAGREAKVRVDGENGGETDEGDLARESREHGIAGEGSQRNALLLLREDDDDVSLLSATVRGAAGIAHSYSSHSSHSSQRHHGQSHSVNASADDDAEPRGGIEVEIGAGEHRSRTSVREGGLFAPSPRNSPSIPAAAVVADDGNVKVHEDAVAQQGVASCSGAVNVEGLGRNDANESGVADSDRAASEISCETQTRSLLQARTQNLTQGQQAMVESEAEAQARKLVKDQNVHVISSEPFQGESVKAKSCKSEQDLAFSSDKSAPTPREEVSSPISCSNGHISNLTLTQARTQQHQYQHHLLQLDLLSHCPTLADIVPDTRSFSPAPSTSRSHRLRAHSSNNSNNSSRKSSRNHADEEEDGKGEEESPRRMGKGRSLVGISGGGTVPIGEISDDPVGFNAEDCAAMLTSPGGAPRQPSSAISLSHLALLESTRSQAGEFRRANHMQDLVSTAPSPVEGYPSQEGREGEGEGDNEASEAEGASLSSAACSERGDRIRKEENSKSMHAKSMYSGLAQHKQQQQHTRKSESRSEKTAPALAGPRLSLLLLSPRMQQQHQQQPRQQAFVEGRPAALPVELALDTAGSHSNSQSNSDTHSHAHSNSRSVDSAELGSIAGTRGSPAPSISSPSPSPTPSPMPSPSHAHSQQACGQSSSPAGRSPLLGGKKERVGRGGQGEGGENSSAGTVAAGTVAAAVGTRAPQQQLEDDASVGSMTSYTTKGSLSLVGADGVPVPVSVWGVGSIIDGAGLAVGVEVGIGSTEHERAQTAERRSSTTRPWMRSSEKPRSGAGTPQSSSLRANERGSSSRSRSSRKVVPFN